MLKTLDRIAEGLISLSALIGTLGLMAEVAVILIDVIGRYFGAPLKGAQDVSTMGLVLIVFGGMALCDRLGGHIAVDVLEARFPPWLNRLGDIASALLGAAVFLGIAWTMTQSAALSRMLHLATNIIYLPKAWFQYAAVAMSLVTAFAMLLRALTLAAGHPWPGREPAQ